MIRQHSTKQSSEPVLESEQLQALVIDLTETKEGAIGGGVSGGELDQIKGGIRKTLQKS